MSTEIITAIIGLVGVLIGLGASYFLQARQRRWALDDQKREWRRSQLKNIAEQIDTISLEVAKHLASSDKKLAGEELKNMVNLASEFYVKLNFSLDRELYKRFLAFGDTFGKAISAEGEERENMISEFKQAHFNLHSRINELIEETYD